MLFIIHTVIPRQKRDPTSIQDHRTTLGLNFEVPLPKTKLGSNWACVSQHELESLVLVFRLSVPPNSCHVNNPLQSQACPSRGRSTANST